MEEKSRHYKSSKSLEQSKCIYVVGEHSDNNISTASFEPILTQLFRTKAKLAGFL
jgi:hypothetical protein